MATDRDRHPFTRGRAVWFTALGLALLLLSIPVSADTMRCGSQVITEGDTIEDVLGACGEPTTRSRTWIQRPPQYEIGSQEYSFPGREDVPVDLWSYEGGPGKLTQRVRFIAGKVTSIETL